MFLNEVCILKMLNFDRIDFLKKLMLNKCIKGMWYFSLLVFIKILFQPNVCNKCHDLLMNDVYEP